MAEQLWRALPVQGDKHLVALTDAVPRAVEKAYIRVRSTYWRLQRLLCQKLHTALILCWPAG